MISARFPLDSVARFADAMIPAFYRALPPEYSVRYMRTDDTAAQLRVQLNRPGGRYETRADIIFGKHQKIRVRFMNSLQSVPAKELPGSTPAEEVVRIVVHELLKERRKKRST